MLSLPSPLSFVNLLSLSPSFPFTILPFHHPSLSLVSSLPPPPLSYLPCIIRWLLGYHVTEHIITRLPFGQNNLGISEATTIALLCTLMELCIGNVDNARWVGPSMTCCLAYCAYIEDVVIIQIEVGVDCTSAQLLL